MLIHNQKRASYSKSAITKPKSGCVRIACSGLIITSLLQVVNRLAASCELHSGLMKYQIAENLMFTDLMQLNATCIESAVFLALYTDVDSSAFQ